MTQEPTPHEMVETVKHLRWYASEYEEKARSLRQELGEDFLRGGRLGDEEKRDELLRQWRYHYRKAGLLP